MGAGESSFGALLKQYRQAAGLTQGRLAERAGLSERAISDQRTRNKPHPAPGDT